MADSNADSTPRGHRLMKGYALFLHGVLGRSGWAAWRQEAAPAKVKFHRDRPSSGSNIVEPDGNCGWCSRTGRARSGDLPGEAVRVRGAATGPGSFFFKRRGDGERRAHLRRAGAAPTGRYAASSGFSFDQFNQDQVVYLQYNDENGRRNMGLTVADRADADIHDLVAQRDAIAARCRKVPKRAEGVLDWQAPRDGVPLFAQRVYVRPRREEGWRVINLSDPSGQPRLRLQGRRRRRAASLEFLDEKGEVTARFRRRRRAGSATRRSGRGGHGRSRGDQ
jgi:hypothetical protein